MTRHYGVRNAIDQETVMPNPPSEGSTEDLQVLPDEQLLERFVGASGPSAEVAFRTLVARHGPMVLGVCRSVLGRLHESEDVFQATFLALARNAGAIRNRRMVGRWLQKAVHRIAIRSRARAVRRRVVEEEAFQISAPRDRHQNEPAWEELLPLLHEEIDRLPETYRTAVILCYFKGYTNVEAARLLRCPVGTVKGRISRARELLRLRLVRRGMTFSLAWFAWRLSRIGVPAERLPVRLVEATTRLCVAAAREEGGLALVPDHLLELARVASPVRVRRVGRLAGVAAIRLTGVAAIMFVVVLAMVGFSAIEPPGGSSLAGSSVLPASARPAAIVPDGVDRPSTCHGEGLPKPPPCHSPRGARTFPRRLASDLLQTRRSKIHSEF
jgi:RNA polymerase sigma factor (sigma-70 family)